MHTVLVRHEAFATAMIHASDFLGEQMTIDLLDFSTIGASGVWHIRTLLSVRFADGRSIPNLE